MPRSVWVAVLALSGTLVLHTLCVGAVGVANRGVAGGVAIALPVLIGEGLLLAGFFHRVRLAWHVGRVAAFLVAAALTAIVAAVAMWAGTDRTVTMGLMQTLIYTGVYVTPAVLLWIVYASLGFHAAQRYFRVRCPSCGMRTRPAGLLTGRLPACRWCGHTDQASRP